MVELLDCLHQPEVSLFDEVEERHATAGVLLCDAHDKSQVCLDHVVPRALTSDRVLAQGTAMVPCTSGVGECLDSKSPSLDCLGKLDFRLCIEKWHASDLTQVQPNSIIALSFVTRNEHRRRQ